MNEIVYALVGGLVGSIVTSVFSLLGVRMQVKQQSRAILEQGKQQIEVIKKQAENQAMIVDRKKKAEVYKEAIEWILKHQESLGYMLDEALKNEEEREHTQRFEEDIFGPAMKFLDSNCFFLPQELYSETRRCFQRIDGLLKLKIVRLVSYNEIKSPNNWETEKRDKIGSELNDRQTEERNKAYELIQKFKDNFLEGDGLDESSPYIGNDRVE